MERSGTLLTQGKKLKPIKVHYTWIYVTERCNLHCDYCFFRHMHGREISMDAVEQLFLLFEREDAVPSTLVFSGGRILAKENLFKIASEARRRFKDISLHIQTNGLLIDQDSIARLRQLGVSLEFGIDGGFEETKRHRCGLKPASFKKLTDTIGDCVKAGLSCGSTMTVHPEEVGHMEQGLDFLRKMGIPHVDITPAAFMPWTAETVAQFKKNYLTLARRTELRKVLYANADNQWIAPGFMDLSLHPPGYLLGGDQFLCLPENKRIEFNMWDASNGSFKPEVLSFYQESYEQLHQKHEKVPYREHVSHSFDMVNTMMGEKYMNTNEINELQRFLTRTHVALGIRKFGT